MGGERKEEKAERLTQADVESYYKALVNMLWETNIPMEQKAQKHIEIWYTIDVFQSWKDIIIK